MKSEEPKEELKPLDLNDDTKRFNAIAETSEIHFRKCFHNKEKLSYDREKQSLRCTCGAAWQGYGLDKLYDLLINRVSDINK